MVHATPGSFLEDLNRRYEALHTAKEDAFWTAMMGTGDDARSAQTAADEREIELQRFLQDPAQLRAARETREVAIQDEAPPDVRTALDGWVAMFEAHVIESAEARSLAEEIVSREGRLASARGDMQLGYRDPAKGFVPASSVALATMLRSEPDEALRRAAWEGLASIETFVLENEFLDIVRERNRLGRTLGAEDYYDWKTRTAERMSKREVFDLLDELEAKTREPARRAVEELRRRPGGPEVTPWNFNYMVSGDTTREQDPYFPFATAIERWGRSFDALGIRYRGAELVLDLLDREGKYENGFMHGPVVAWRDGEQHRAARIHFTANAIPGMVGSGQRAMETLFHEGGHAAHFANIDMPAPCFGQEFAPTSVGFSETQSMFLDSLLSDADWRSRYALDESGSAMPWDVIERGIRATQPFAACQVRAMLTVCYAERALYELPEEELHPARVTEVLREIERDMLFVDASPRPVLAIPHLLAGDSSAYYHGYVLAEMAVHETREFFLERDGHLVDNGRIGADLEATYWRPGNSVGFSDFVRRLTGHPLRADELAARVGRTVEEALADAQAAISRLNEVPRPEGPIELDAQIRIVHGRETVAESSAGFGELAQQFGRWIHSR